MESWGWIWVVGLVAVAIFVFVLAAIVALFLLGYALTGAWLIFVMAASQGFIGIVVFLAAWVFLFPFMLVWAIVWGYLATPTESKPKAPFHSVPTPPADPEERYKWANRLPPYEDK